MLGGQQRDRRDCRLFDRLCVEPCPWSTTHGCCYAFATLTDTLPFDRQHALQRFAGRHLRRTQRTPSFALWFAVLYSSHRQLTFLCTVILSSF
jgi:hypothetical protein